MIDIINKIFEAYNEEAWSGSENGSEDMALNSALYEHIKGIHWILEYNSPLQNPSYDPDIHKLRFFNIQYCKIFEQLEKEDLFHVYNEDWTEEISLNPSVLPDSPFTINVVINLSWKNFIKYLYEYKEYLHHPFRNAFPAGLFAEGTEFLLNIKSFSFPENPIQSLDFYPAFNNLFIGCHNLKSVYLENSTRKIKEFVSTFQWCHSLESVPVLDISNADNLECMFQSCKNITSVKFKNDNLMPDNVSLRRTNMFSSCEKLENVIWDINGKNDYVRPLSGNDEYECLYMFKRCENLSSKVLNDCGGLDRTGTPMFLPTFQNKN